MGVLKRSPSLSLAKKTRIRWDHQRGMWRDPLNRLWLQECPCCRKQMLAGINRKHCVDCGRIYRAGSARAHNIISGAIRCGLLLPANQCDCTDCERPASVYDHRDYNKPLDVEPVCRRCNHKRGNAIAAVHLK